MQNWLTDVAIVATGDGTVQNNETGLYFSMKINCGAGPRIVLEIFNLK